jgi:hypothetical protein
MTLKSVFYINNQSNLDKLISKEFNHDVEVRIDSKDKIVIQTHKKFKFILLNNTKALSYGSPIISLFGKSKIFAYDRSFLNAYDDSRVVAKDYASAELHDRSFGVAYDFCKFFTKNNSTAHLKDYSYCLAKNNSKNNMYEYSSLDAWGESEINSFSKNSKVSLFERSKFYGYSQIVDRRKDFYTKKDYLELCYKVDDSHVLLFKSISSEGTDFYTNKIKFKLGENVCLNFDDNEKNEFSSGFHLCRTPYEALSYHPYGEVIRAKVHIDDLIIIPSDYTKIRCKKFFWIKD